MYEKDAYDGFISDIEVVRPSPDLTRQLLERKDRLRFLIGFINENGALGKVPTLTLFFETLFHESFRRCHKQADKASPRMLKSCTLRSNCGPSTVTA